MQPIAKYDISPQCVYGIKDPITKKCICNEGFYDIPASPYLCAWPSYLPFQVNFTDISTFEEDESMKKMMA